MNGSFKGKVAFLTGAGSGIGRATALAFTRESASVMLADVSERGNQETARALVKVSLEAMILEGPAFERNGNLLFCDVSGRRVLRLTTAAAGQRWRP